MKPLTVLMCAAVLAATVVYVGQAAPNKPVVLPIYEFVGYSTATRDGDDGFVGMNIACQAVSDDFGPDARQASVKEFVESATTDVPGVDGAYISPGIGAASGTVGELVGGFSCQGYSNTGGGAGLVVTQTGSIIESTCASSREVACSAPVQ